MQNKSLEGLFTALITPFDHDGKVDYSTLRNLLHRQLDAKADGIVCLGTTSEHFTLAKEEEERIVKLCVETVGGKAQLFVGSGTPSTQTTIEKTKWASGLGADGCLILTPYCNRPSPEGCIQHYEQISRLGIPFILYHHPKRAGIELSFETLSEISKLPHIAGIKEASGDFELFERLCQGPIPVFSGDDPYFVAQMRLGAKGIISAMANLLPVPWKEIASLCLQQRFTEAERAIAHYHELMEAVFSEVNPQGIKYAMHLENLCEPFLRLPLIEPSEVNKKKIAESFKVLAF